MEGPLLIVAQLISGLINGILGTIFFVLSKFVELMMALMFDSSFGAYGFIVAVVVGAVVFLFVTKFVFQSTRTLIALGIAFIAVIAVLAFLWAI